MQAVDECISNGILEDFLKKNKAEAIKMSIYEYDQEKHMKWIREEGFEEGEIIGYIKYAIKDNASREKIINAVMKEFNLKEKEAKVYYEKVVNKLN